jgi:hypothetical protein
MKVHGNTTHGRSAGSKTYTCWRNMKSRCLNPNNKDFSLYGGRGIKVCDRWLTFEGFLADMGTIPDGMTLERVNRDGDYQLSNCKWSTRTEQANNRSSNHVITFSSRTQTATQWASELGIKRRTLLRRIERGWSIQRTLTTPV